MKKNALNLSDYLRNSVLSSPTWRIDRPEKGKKIRLKDDKSSALKQAINPKRGI